MPGDVDAALGLPVQNCACQVEAVDVVDLCVPIRNMAKADPKFTTGTRLEKCRFDLEAVDTEKRQVHNQLQIKVKFGNVQL
jgi:hypothetical protein